MHSIFSHLVGNPKAKDLLTRLLLNESFPHTVLFQGIEGIGKSLFAMTVAQQLVKKIKKEDPDIHILKPDSKSRLHPIASIRSMIQEAFLPPFESPNKIFIIHEAEKMLPVSSNALLKILEEPPNHTYFILLTSEPKLLLSTIVSRCTNIAFFPISDEEVASSIVKQSQIVEAKKYAVLSEGSLSKAYYLLASVPTISIEKLFTSNHPHEFYQLLSKVEEPSEEYTDLYLNRVFEELLYWIREHNPLKLEEAVLLIQDARFAFNHHIKLRTILENLFLSLH